MQVFMQVLKPELGGEAPKPVGKAEGVFSVKGDGTFAALLEGGDESVEGELPETVEAEVGDERDVKRQPVVPDSHEKASFFSRQATLGSQPPLEAATPRLSDDGVKDSKIKAIADSEPVPGIERPKSVDAKPVPTVSIAKPEGADRPRRDLHGGKSSANPEKSPDKTDGKRESEGKREAASLVERAPLAERREIKRSGEPSVRPEKSKLDSVNKVPDVVELPMSDKRNAKPLLEQPEVPAKKDIASRILPEVTPKVSDTKPEAKVTSRPEPRTVVPSPKDKPPTIVAHEKPNVELPARASETAVKAVAAQIPSGIDKPMQPKSSRRVERDLRAEVTITTTDKPAAQPAKPDVSDPVPRVQLAPLPKDFLAGQFHFGRDPTVARDEAAVRLPPLDTSEVRRPSEPVSSRVEVQARPVITQLVQSAKSAIDGMIEVKLSPEELGRVRLAMTSGEAGMTVTVTAERAETLDLIRRNIDLFATDLAKEGFEDLSFSFGQESAGERQESADAAPAEDGPLNVTQLNIERLTVRSAASDGRLDIRL